jgi:uncharacterized protein YjbI with pentapeptide repeats
MAAFKDELIRLLQQTRRPRPGRDPGDDAVRPASQAARALLAAHAGQPLDLKGADLRGCALRDMDLGEADLRDADLREADLRGADLSEARLRGDTYFEPEFGEPRLTDAVFDGRTRWPSPYAFDFRMCGAVGPGAILRGRDLSEAAWLPAQLSAADLSDAKLAGIALRGGDMVGARFCRADLHGATLAGMDLRFADFREANLRRADFTGSDLRGADLRGAWLGFCSFDGANLDGARFDPGMPAAIAPSPAP